MLIVRIGYVTHILLVWCFSHDRSAVCSMRFRVSLTHYIHYFLFIRTLAVFNLTVSSNSYS